MLAGGKPAGNCYGVTNGAPTGTAAAATLTLADPGSTTVTVANCTDKGGFWDCPSPTFSRPGFCKAPPRGSFRVFVLKAKLLSGGFTFSMGTPLTLVCGGNDGNGPQTPSCAGPQPELFSTAGDCIDWNYGPTTPGDQRRFNACVRMARADYLGNGSSATRVGTHIQPGSSADRCDCTDCESCLEAYWTDLGAICIFHPRWKEVVTRVTTILGPKAGEMMKSTFPDTVEYEKKVFKCRRGMTPPNAVLWNRSRIHSCNGSTLNISPCPRGAFDPDCPQCPH